MEIEALGNNRLLSSFLFNIRGKGSLSPMWQWHGGCVWQAGEALSVGSVWGRWGGQVVGSPSPPTWPTAQLLRQGDHGGVAEEDRHLLEAAHQRQRGDHLRLQVPHRGRQDPLPLWLRELPGDPQLGPAPSRMSATTRHARGLAPPPTPISGAVLYPVAMSGPGAPTLPPGPPWLQPLSGKGLLCLSARVSWSLAVQCPREGLRSPPPVPLPCAPFSICLVSVPSPPSVSFHKCCYVVSSSLFFFSS